jgi:hypothetical protein
MIGHYALPTLLLFIPLAGSAQQYTQYFDGAPPSSTTLTVHIDTTAGTLWQVGPPQKTVFLEPASPPNVIVTDTVSPYPADNRSWFEFDVPTWGPWGILAIQWMQWIDTEEGDGGTVEFSVDHGETWESAFNNPYVYNFYGHLPQHEGLLASGETGFTGRDTSWRDMWLCYDFSWLEVNDIDSIRVRFIFSSDTLDATSGDGWMIDNIIGHITFIHTVNEKEQDVYMKVFPNPTADLLYIETQKLMELHIIERMRLFDGAGRVVQEWRNIPTRFFIDTRRFANGIYHLEVATNKRTEKFTVEILH